MNDQAPKQVCTACEEDLTLDQFHRNRRTKSGHMNICRTCRSRTRTDFHHIPAMEDRLDSITLEDLVRFSDLYEEDRASGCWRWRGARTEGGYAAFWHRGGKVLGHRWAVAAYGVAFDLDHDIHHRCGDRTCVNPKHLEPLDSHTHQQLHAEKRRKNRARKQLTHFGQSRSRKNLVSRDV